MTNVANEHGEVLNSVLTTGERAGLNKLGQGIAKRYADANEQQPLVIYVDRDCCSPSGMPPILEHFQPWTCAVR